MEDNRIENQPKHVTPANPRGKVYNHCNDDSRFSCAAEIGRNCEANFVTGSGDFPRRKVMNVLTKLDAFRENLVTLIRYDDTKGHVDAYGIGRIN